MEWGEDLKRTRLFLGSDHAMEWEQMSFDEKVDALTAEMPTPEEDELVTIPTTLSAEELAAAHAEHFMNRLTALTDGVEATTEQPGSRTAESFLASSAFLVFDPDSPTQPGEI